MFISLIFFKLCFSRGSSLRLFMCRVLKFGPFNIITRLTQDSVVLICSHNKCLESSALRSYWFVHRTNVSFEFSVFGSRCGARTKHDWASLCQLSMQAWPRACFLLLRGMLASQQYSGLVIN